MSQTVSQRLILERPSCSVPYHLKPILMFSYVVLPVQISLHFWTSFDVQTIKHTETRTVVGLISLLLTERDF